MTTMMDGTTSVVISITAKTSIWLSILAPFAVGMLFYTMIPMISPLNSNVVNVLLSLVGRILFSIIIGLISNLILKKYSVL